MKTYNSSLDVCLNNFKYYDINPICYNNYNYEFGAELGLLFLIMYIFICYSKK